LGTGCDAGIIDHVVVGHADLADVCADGIALIAEGVLAGVAHIIGVGIRTERTHASHALSLRVAAGAGVLAEDATSIDGEVVWGALRARVADQTTVAVGYAALHAGSEDERVAWLAGSADVVARTRDTVGRGARDTGAPRGGQRKSGVALSTVIGGGAEPAVVHEAEQDAKVVDHLVPEDAAGADNRSRGASGGDDAVLDASIGEALSAGGLCVVGVER
jgi:hypothetical protein